MSVLLDNWQAVLEAFTYTVLLFIIAGLLSLILGTFLVAMRVGPIGVLSKAATTYVTVVRNTPLLMIFMFFQYAAPKIGFNPTFVDIHIGRFDFTSFFANGVIACTLYTAAFVCEALRSGVNAVDLGQAEAARAIGLPFAGVMREVVLPQAFRASVPPLASVLIALLKNTSVAAGFGVLEAVAQMKIFTNNFASERWGIFLGIALIYVLLVEIVSLIANRIERRWRIA